MYGKLISGCLHGIDGKIIEVEIDISNGLPQMNIVGLPDGAIRESVERVRSAIKNSEFSFPLQRITVNLAPADVRKEGSAFDLAIAAGILLTSEQIRFPDLEHSLFIGELALDGTLRPIHGVLSLAQAAKAAGVSTLVLPYENAGEALLIDGIKIIPLKHLKDISSICEKGGESFVNDINIYQDKHLSDSPLSSDLADYADVKGHAQIKRAMVVAAAGMHNILLIGPPGSGKTMLIRRLPSILPLLSDAEALEVTKIYSIADRIKQHRQLIRNRPFRAPHHTISGAGLIGGGSPPKPGEVTLAHKGVLFLDEIPEFPRNVLEALRQPLEDRHVTISRSRGSYVFPTHFILACSMNPCPCGFFGYESEANSCNCHDQKIAAYRSKISGPLLDRIDLHVDVPILNYNELADHTPIDKKTSPSPDSSEMRKQVQQAQRMQEKRFKGSGIHFNSEMSGKLLGEFCRLSPETEQLMFQSFTALGLSVRAHDRILKIARTIADLEHSCSIETPHLAEALQYRVLDRKK